MSNPHSPLAQDQAGVDRQVDRSVTRSLKDHLSALGADLVGIGSCRASPGSAGDTCSRARYLPDATALISMALRVNEAACDLIAREHPSVKELPASYHSYQMFTLTIINPQLDRLAYLGAKFLEQRGYRAYPFPANLPHVLKPSAEYPGGPGGHLTQARGGGLWTGTHRVAHAV